MINAPHLIQFDWSGTLSDDTQPVHAASIKMHLAYGIEPIYDLDKWLITTTAVKDYFVSKGITDSFESIWKLYTKCLAEVTNEGIKPTLYADSQRVLESLKKKGKKLIVISSHPHNHLIEEAKEYGLTDYFDEIIGSVSDKTVGIVEANKRFGIHPDNSIYVGDMVGDILAARKAKVKIIALSRGYHSADVLKKHKPFKLWNNLLPAETEL